MNTRRHFIFGPVPSRRLGRSLGIDVIPAKICTLDCIYCEVGPTTRRVVERLEYIPTEEILAEMRSTLPPARNTDWITFTGSGEPTLNLGLGRLIREAKRLTTVPVAVITNGTLLGRPDVQDDLLAADAVLPSLDAVTPRIFRRLNRPAPGLEPGELVRGMCAFRKRYTGQLWLEVLVAEGFNDTDAEVHALRSAIERIAPDRIHLNTVVRPPAYAAARPVPSRRLGEIAAMLGQKCSIACSSPADEAIGAPVPPEAIAAMLSRRPMTCGELAAALRLGLPQVDEALGRLIEEGRLFRVAHDGRVYYETPRESRGAG